MTNPLARLRAALVPAALLFGTAALAGGGPVTSGATGSSAPATTAPASTTYRCNGGVNVRVTPNGNTARVNFAGRSRTLKLVRGAQGVRFENADFSWQTGQDGAAFMRDRESGKLVLSGCVAPNS